MDATGKWWWFFGEERFDIDETRWLELADGVATDTAGGRGSFTLNGSGLRVVMPDGAELTVRQAGPSMDDPIWLSGHFSDGDDLVVFAKDGDWAQEMTNRNRKRAGRYTTIDISMYPLDAPGRAELSAADTVEGVEAALKMLPKATYTHAAEPEVGPYGGRPEGVPGFP